MKKTLSLIAVLLLAGCTSTTYTEQSGTNITVQLKRTSFMTKAIIANVRKTEHGIEITGYNNDVSAQVAAITQAAVEGAVKGAKP